MSGEQAKQLGLDLVTEHNSIFLARMRCVARSICDEKGSVTVDELRQWANKYKYAPEHPNAWGAVFRSGFVRVGFRKSTTPSAHSRMVSVWRRI